MSGDLLQTKLYVPQQRPFLVARPHLIRKLNQGWQQGYKLSLISAPAGFGKTTLVAAWGQQLVEMEANPKSDILKPNWCWLSLDESDNNLTRFLTYFITALTRVEAVQSIAENALTMLQSPRPVPAERIMTLLINEFASHPGNTILVLDDYHLIESQSIHDALSFFLDNQPPGFHLVIVTREDPFLSLSRLRARGQLTELRAADLRFTNDEAAKFLNQVMGLSLSAADITALETRTEGWIAGLQLAALALQGLAPAQSDFPPGQNNATNLIKAFTGSHRFVLDYLIEEVLERQPTSVQTFLLQTSVLDRLNGSLCDAVHLGAVDLTEMSTARPGDKEMNGQEILEMLERANLFIVPLDDERRWYRYHHLFTELLRQRLHRTHPDQLPLLHRRASHWFEENRSTSDSIRHALAAADFERAADLIEYAWPAWSAPVPTITWLSWVQRLPEALVRTRPVLCVAIAQSLLNAGLLEAAEGRLQDAECWLEPQSNPQDFPTSKMVVADEAQFRSLPASLAMARAYHAQAVGDLPGTVKYSQRVLELLPKEEQYIRNSITMLLGLAQWAQGDLESAYITFSTGLAHLDIAVAITSTFVLAAMKMGAGQLHAAARAFAQALQQLKTYDDTLPMGTEDVYTGLSKLHRERGDLETAAQHLATAKRLGEQAEIPDWEHRWCVAQARLYETLGDFDRVLVLLDEAERLFVRTPVPDLRPVAALRASVWVKQGRLAEAQDWARTRGLTVDDDLTYLHEFEHITLARVLIARYERERADASLHPVLGLLERLLQTAEKAKRIGSVIEILVMQAIAYDAEKNTPLALQSLERAFTLAEPEGYVHIFVDEGQRMVRLLSAALAHKIAPDYVRLLLSANFAAIAEQTPPSRTPAAIPKPQSGMVEPLSEREIEVLELIAEGLTNQEIATRLYLSLNTIKVHTRNIYSKLDVHHRTGAAAKGRALGILPTT